MNQPAYFISHGAPDLIISDIPAQRFIIEQGQSWQQEYQQGKLKGIILLSAHWSSRTPGELSIENNDKPEIQYDFSGFSADLYQIQYSGWSRPEQRKEIAGTLLADGWQVSEVSRPLDHGSWVPLKLIDPEAGIPVTNISLPAYNSAAEAVRLGRSLAQLRDSGYLIIGSGALTHNLRLAGPEGTPVPDWALEFEQQWQKVLLAGNLTAVVEFMSEPLFHKAHPTTEHFLPLLISAASAGEEFEVRQLHQSFSYQSIAMHAYAFSQTPKA